MVAVSAAKSAAKTGTLLSDMDPVSVNTVVFKIVGDSALITHRWSEKAKKQMRDKQTGEASANRNKDPKNPREEFLQAMYLMGGSAACGEHGNRVIDDESPEFKVMCFDCESEVVPALPTIMFKCAAVDAASQLAGVTKVFLRGAFHTIGELVKIQLPEHVVPIMREDMARVGMGTADLRYRPAFHDWWVELPVRFNTRAMTLPQLIDLFNQAGFSTGVGEWRPQKDGSFGMFHVDSVAGVE